VPGDVMAAITGLVIMGLNLGIRILKKKRWI
jgi:hypothetical protein